MKLNRKSLGIKLWIYFTVFIGGVLILMWLLQTVFLSSFYKGMKEKSVEAVADEISKTYGEDNFTQTIDRLVFENSLLVYVTGIDGTLLYSSDEHAPGGEFGKPDIADNFGEKGSGGGGGGGRHGLPLNYSEFLQKLSESYSGTIAYTVTQGNLPGESLIYGKVLGDEVLYISTPIEPLDGTIKILRNQLIYITIITVIAGFVIAFFISRKLANPIVKITKTAEQLATGDYAVQFEKGAYAEIDALSETLNYTATELSKVEGLRRELIANISHDLRTPLTMIKGYTEMLEEVSGSDPESRARHLAIIKSESTRLEGLVGDILDLSILQSGNERLNAENINLSDIVKNVLIQFETLAEQDGYLFVSEIAFDQYAFADKVRMQQVLYNLIGNAVNYAGEDKTVRVNLIDLGSIVRFEVRDTGVGISEEDLPYIWDRYYKSNEHVRPKMSTGIGLSIVKNVLELHRAKFGVTSKPGQGSTFWFELKK